MEPSWKNDPRLKQMSPQKLEYLEMLAKRTQGTPKNQLMPLLMNMSQDTKALQFTDQETDLLVSVMTAGFSPAEKQKLTLLRQLSGKLGKNH